MQSKWRRAGPQGQDRFGGLEHGTAGGPPWGTRAGVPSSLPDTGWECGRVHDNFCRHLDGDFWKRGMCAP